MLNKKIPLKMTKILIVGPAWIGDMVMAQSLYRVLAKRYPGVIIDVLAPASSGAIVAHMPEVRRFIPLPIGHGKLHLWQRYRLACRLREERYQQAIVLPNSFKSALIPFWAKIPTRTGWRGEMRYFILNDLRILNKKAIPLMVDRFIALGLEKRAVLPEDKPIPSLEVSSQAVVIASQKQGIQHERPVAAFCPGAEYGPAKRWPIEHFVTLGKALIQKGRDIWLFGGPNDISITQAICNGIGMHCIDLGGKTSLPEAVNLLSLAEVVVSNDSGLMHIAAALKRPLIVIYGSSDPRHTPPLAQQVKILTLGLSCSPCFERECPLGHLRCLHDLKPEQVLQALNELRQECK